MIRRQKRYRKYGLVCKKKLVLKKDVLFEYGESFSRGSDFRSISYEGFFVCSTSSNLTTVFLPGRIAIITMKVRLDLEY